MLARKNNLMSIKSIYFDIDPSLEGHCCRLLSLGSSHERSVGEIMDRLKGKIALVTGAGQGIGHAIADRFDAEGAIVIATDIKGTSETLDVAEPADWDRVVDATIARYGSVDVLVNNAGIVLAYEAIHETELATWAKVVAVNQTGTFLGMRAVIPQMLRTGGGSIVNLSSIWGSVGASGAAAYQAAKGAVRNMTKNAAVTYGGAGIRVNSVHPGIIYTPLIAAQPDSMNAAIVAVTPLNRMGRPEDVANGCLYLASDEAAFVTGAELAIDGGYLAQ